MTIKILDKRSGRKRTRCVSIDGSIAKASEAASNRGVGINYAHGGSVCNSYGYSTKTEAVGTVAIAHNGQLYVRSVATELPANKVTLSGAAAATLGYRLGDGRMSQSTKDEIKSKLICKVAEELAVWE